MVIKIFLKIFAGALFIAASMPAAAAPRAQSDAECYLFADVALVARALNLESIPERTADAILAHIYSLPLHTGGERFISVMGAIASAARRLDDYDAPVFASRLYSVCLGSGGNMDSILGVDS